MKLPEICSAHRLETVVREIGFLPFFKNIIPGFSIEENCPRELWFSENGDGPWEWKGPVIRNRTCIYGKLFRGGAGYVSLDWMPDLVNCRRDGYDFDSRWDDGLAQLRDKEIYDVLADEGPILSKELKRRCGYCGRDGKKGFDTVITRLQMQTYATISDFVYMKDKYGRVYGWGVAQYAAPEKLFGYDAVTAAYTREPEESKRRIEEHLAKLLPEADKAQIARLIK